VPAWATLGVFALAALALLVVPGPSVLYIVTQSVRDGRRAGLVSMLGIQTGALVHVTAAALGLSALLVSSATAFDAVKFAGAAYLVYLGVRRLLGRDELVPADPRGQVELRRLYRQGIVVNVLNPKTGLFFLALLPQFVDPARGPVVVQVLVLGLLFIVLALVSDGLWAVFAGTFGERLRSSRAFARAQRYVSGSVFLGLGLVAALSAAPARAR
jgi:threonine/homoserine/homoserine lactone efflux protein